LGLLRKALQNNSLEGSNEIINKMSLCMSVDTLQSRERERKEDREGERGRDREMEI